jgi:hypothetical protein
MVLWVDVRDGSYGVQAEAGYLDNDSRAVQFDVSEEVAMEVSAVVIPLNPGSAGNQRARTATSSGNLPAVRFGPDGFLVETSPEFVTFRENRPGENSAVWVAQAANRHGYEIRDTQPLLIRR